MNAVRKYVASHSLTTIVTDVDLDHKLLMLWFNAGAAQVCIDASNNAVAVLVACGAMH